MIVHYGYKELHIKNPVVTLGIFDGVHLGHKALIDRLVSMAGRIRGESVIITFYPHPKLVLSGNISELFFLTSLEEKTGLLEKEGIDHLIIIPFDHELSNKEACQFIEDVLVKKIGTKCLIVGFNHHFGKNGEGDLSVIRQCAESYNIIVEQVEEIKTESGPMSSSSIRDALLSGDLDKANSLLGYSYFINGTVTNGKMLGRGIGFPTANIVPDYENKLIPKDGVYAVEVMIDSAMRYGMLSIGTNPTVNSDNAKRSIEVNIFDFDREIYNSRIRVNFMYRIREIIKFNNISDLALQLEDDKKTALRFLSK